jgi:hypothetical protein
MSLVQLSAKDGSWERLKTAWKGQCEQVGEDFGLYAQGNFIIFNGLIEKPEDKAGIYGVRRGDDAPEVICQINTTPLPGHPEPVMRIRMVTLCPAIDFGTIDQGRYIETLADLFFGIVELLEDHRMGAKEFKLHLRSPEDFNFFRAVSKSLQKLANFSHVGMHGAWLHVIKS